ncbi:MAG: antitoxin VapB family protein [Candidatus Lutacidiplasmatales archaeon]
MSSRNVAIRKDVYTALSRQKRARESFTQLFVRLMGQHGILEELSGSWAAPGSDSAYRSWNRWRRPSTARRSK